MGQKIQIASVRVVGDTASYTTDRHLSSPDGETFAGLADAESAGTIPARLAVRLFEAVDGIVHIFAGSNHIVIRRSGGWDEAAESSASAVIESFYSHYAAASQA